MREIDTHHMIFGRRAWTNKGIAHREVRRHPAFMYDGLRRDFHDVLHRVLDAVPIPEENVAYDLLQIGEDTLKRPQQERTIHQLDIMAGYIRGHRIPESAMGMAYVMGSFAAQQGIFELAESMRPM